MMTPRHRRAVIGSVTLALSAALLLSASPRPALAGQVYVEDSPAAADLVASAEDRLEKDEPNEAARLLQEALNKHGSKLLSVDEERYLEAHHVAERLLLKDETLLESYRQLYGPTAAQQMKQAGNDPRKLKAILRRYGLTQAGLTAGLRLAGTSLEAGDAAEAAIFLDRLEEHPDLDQQRVLWQYLSAVAALLGERPQRLQAFRGQLKEGGLDRIVQRLDQLDDRMNRPAVAPSHNPLDPLPAADPPDAASDPLWTRATEGAESFLINTYSSEEDTVSQRAGDGRYLNVMPTVDDGTLFINDGRTVSAFEPASGMPLWEQRIVEAEPQQRRFSRRLYQQWLPKGVDINAVASADGHVVAIGGYAAMVTGYPFHQRTSTSRLVCLDARHGAERWSMTPEELDDALSDGFWYGRPIVSQGRIYATVRRRQRTQFQDAYLVALDLRTGERLWMQHLASTALTDRQSVPRLTHIALHDGWLYFDSRLGTIGKLSASDGTVRWLRRVPVDEQNRRQRAYRPWHGSAPVLVDAGLLVLDDWAGIVRVLDPQTGERKEIIATESWGDPRYILPVGSDVVSVGDEIARYRGSDLEETWTHDVEGPRRGRAVVADRRLYLPLDEQLAVIDLEKGERLKGMDVQLPANVLPLDGQLIVAHRKGVSGYSSWDLASGQLRETVEQRPDDPRPLMALAWLAFKTGRSDALLDTLDRTVRRLDAEQLDSATGQQLFNQILAMARDSEQAETELRQKLFDRLAAVTQTAKQEVTYRLSLASFYESTEQPGDAVEQYQTILKEPAYRRPLYRHDGGSRQAGLEAQRRLRTLLERHGRELYERQEAYAQWRLKQLEQQADPEPLIELAEAYPLATVAGEALRLAADRAAERGRTSQAIALLRQAVRQSESEESLGRLYGKQVELFVQAGQPHRARRVLRTLTSAHPNVQPLREGEPVSASQWIQQLRDREPASSRTERINLPISEGGAKSLKGHLMRPRRQPDPAAPTAGLLFRSDDTLELRKASDLSRRWSRPAEHADVQLLATSAQHLWLFSARAESVRMLDAETGEEQWRIDSLANKLEAIRNADLNEAQTKQEAHFNRMVGPRGPLVNRGQNRREGPGLMLGVGETSLAVAGRHGRLIVYDADDGSVQWQTATPVRNVSRLLVNERHLVLIGQDNDQAPLIYIYDLQSGSLAHRLLNSNSKREEVRWAGLTEFGLLLYASKHRVEAFDLNRGQSRWISEPGSELIGDQKRAWIGTRRLLVPLDENEASPDDEDLVWIDLNDGRVVGRQPVRGLLRGTRWRVSHDAGAWFVGGTNRIIAFDDEGRNQWQDGISDATRLIEQRVTDRYVLLLGAGHDTRFTDPRHRQLYILNRKTGTLQDEYEVVAPDGLDRMLLLDGKLLLGGSNTTAVLHGAH